MTNSQEEGKNYYSLTHAQKRIFYDDRRHPEEPWANVGFVIKYNEELNLDFLTGAINTVIKKNDGMRLRIVEFDYEPEPSQYIAPYKKFGIDCIEFKGSDCDRQLHKWSQEKTREKMDIFDKDLFYFVCYKMNGSTGYYMKLHHTITDGWSCFLIFMEVNEIYEALEAGREVDESPNPSYTKYIADEQEYLNSPRAAEDSRFWHNNLLPIPEEVKLFSRSGVPKTTEAIQLVLSFPDYLRTMMHQYCRTHKTSLYKLTLSALSVYMSKFSGHNDIVVGGVNHGRSDKSYYKVMGMFVSTLTFRINIDDSRSFTQLVEKTGSEANTIVKNYSRYPYDRLATELREKSDSDIGHLRNIAFIGHSDVKKNRFSYDYIMPGYEPGPLLIHLNLSNKDQEGVLEQEYVFQSERFSEDDIRRIHKGLTNVLTNALENPEKKISDIDILSKEERQKILYDFNDITLEYPRDKTIAQLFEERVVATPDQLALKFRDQELNYRQLNEKANQLAGVLRKKGLMTDDIVSLMVDRSFEMLISIFAILKAGGAYLPMNTDYPEDRISYIVQDSCSKFFLTTEKYLQKVVVESEKINIEDQALYTGDDTNLEHVNRPSDLAYIIYTSGSTGKPKGVMIEHESAVSLLKTLYKKYPLDASDNYLLKTSFMFDVSVSEIFGWFWGGGRLTILEQGGEKDPHAILEAVDKEKITHLNFVPSMFNLFINILSKADAQKLAGLKYIFLAGEAIWPDSVLKFRELGTNVIIENLYGPTEATIYASWYPVGQWPGSGGVPIGKPINNLKLYVGTSKNDRMKLQPVGTPGELLISGIGLARGYLNQPDLTAQQFIPNPFMNEEGWESSHDKLYRTGDLTRWLPDGNVEYMGRIDFQVKVRGYRIEIGEIETQLSKQPEIKEAVVIVKDIGEDKSLCAYVVSDKKVDFTALKAELSKGLMDYMIPSYFIPLEKMPLNPSGKADRKKLMQMDVGISKMRSIQETEVEETSRALKKIDRDQERVESLVAEDHEYPIDKEELTHTEFKCFFLGESPLLIKCAQIVLNSHNEIFGIISDNPEISKWAREVEIPLVRTSSGNLKEFLELKKFDYLFCIHHQVLPDEYLLALPGKRIINFRDSAISYLHRSHASNWAIINGDPSIEICWHTMTHKSSVGDVIQKEKIKIESDDTGASLHQKCLAKGEQLFKKIITGFSEKEISFKKIELRKSETLNPCGLLSFDKTAEEISQFVQGLDFGSRDNPLGIPRLFLELNPLPGNNPSPNKLLYVKDVIILDYDSKKNTQDVGTILEITEGHLTVTTKTNDLELNTILSANGDTVNLEHALKEVALKIGDTIQNPEKKCGIVLTYNSRIQRHEDFWLERLATLQPIIISGSTGESDYNKSTRNIQQMPFHMPKFLENYKFREGTTRRDLLLIAFAAYLSLHTELRTFDLAFSKPTLQMMTANRRLKNVFACQVPIRVKYNTNMSFRQFELQMLDELKEVKRRKTYIHDIYVRYGRLRDIPDSNLDVGVTFTRDSKDIDISLCKQMNLLIPGEDPICTLLYNSAMVEERDVVRLLPHFLDFLHAALTEPDSVIGTELKEHFSGDFQMNGRVQRWIKIGGKNVDIRKTEIQLEKHNDIEKAAAIVKQTHTGLTIQAFTVVTPGKAANELALKKHLLKTLHTEWVPENFAHLFKMPFSEVGEIDYKSLHQLKIKAGSGFKPPRDDVERKLAELFQKVLNIEKSRISITESFFKLGGHSLKAGVLITLIHKELFIKIPMSKIFDTPTIMQLGKYIKEAEKEKFSQITPAPVKEFYPQTSSQMRLYFMDQMERNNTVYNMPMMEIYDHIYSLKKLKNCFNILIRRHESLRTSFHSIDGQPVQKIQPYLNVISTFEIEYYETGEDGRIFSNQEGKEWTTVDGIAFQDVVEHFVRPFDLATAPLIRVGLIKLKDRLQLLMIDMHHIVTDGVSMVILLEELWTLYEGDHLPPLKLQYKDYAEWSNSPEVREEAAKQEPYWLKEFSGSLPVMNLPTDYSRPPRQTFDGGLLNFEINESDARRLKELAQEQGETLFMVLLSMFYVLLAKVSGQEDIIIGTVSAGRNHADLQDIVGMFVDTLALRNYPEGDKRFLDFLEEVKERTLAAFENQDYPFEQLVSKVVTNQDASRNPIFDVVFALENEDDRFEFLLEVLMLNKTEGYDFNIRKSKFDMMLTIVEVADGLQLRFEYNTNLFASETIKRISNYYKKIVTSVCDDIRQKLAAIEIISVAEKEQILFDFNDTVQKYPRGQTVHEMFQQCIEKTPQNIALKYLDDTLSYAEVNEKANQLAWLLRNKGIKPGNLVGIMVERSFEMIVGIFAIIKAGGAYLPIDPNYPEDRVRYLFKDSDAKLLLTQKKHIYFAGTVEFEGEILNLDDPALYLGETQNPDIINSPQDLAYIIYTSGSTGKPKGVAIEHVSAVNLAQTLDRMYPLGAKDSYLLKTAFLFDVSVSEIFGWFWRGGRLVILKQGGEKDPMMMIDIIEEEKITHLNFVPSMFNVFVSVLDSSNKQKLSPLRYIFLAGEAIWPDSIVKFRALGTSVTIENLYGPTEATVYASWYPVAHWQGIGSVSIGKPVDNLDLYILSRSGDAPPALQPVGIAGELTISGIQLARGYLNRPELTARMFTDNPFSSYEGKDGSYKKLYHTGDLCRWSAEGKVEYMGRIDHQVKVRGFRIELGEIESQLSKIENIEEAIVLARESEERKGDKYLCAYLVGTDNIDIPTIRDTLTKELPEYMVPSYFVQLDKIPLNPSGKVDRKALPEPKSEGTTREYLPPANQSEKMLAGIWSDVLGNETISVEDNFFEIGGDSLKSILLSSRLKKIGINIGINDIFSCKTIRKLAERIQQDKPVEIPGEPVIERDEKIVLQSIDEKYQQYRKQVDEETWPVLESKNRYKNILLTGATGYLGAYLLYELLSMTEAVIYLLVRGKNPQDSQKRLQNKLAFYFGPQYFDSHKDRLVVVQGELSRETFGVNDSYYNELSSLMDAVIHSAANVKHYGEYSELYKDNVLATQHLLDFACAGHQKDFHFISTVDVGRGDIPGKDHLLFTEYCVDEGQVTEHIYIRSKLEAEKLVISYREKGLNASIYRAGNVTFHSQTGIFQENIENNGFYAIMKGVARVGYLSQNMKKIVFDMSFVNISARAIVLLLTCNQLINQTFHISNPHKLPITEMVTLLRESGVDVPDVAEEKIEDHLVSFEGNSEFEKIIARVKLDSWAWESIPRTLTVPKEDRTERLLKCLGCKWPKIDQGHIKKMMSYCKEVGFL